MGRAITIRVSDVCIFHSKPKRVTDPDIQCLKWSTFIAQSRFNEIRERANDIFTAVGLSRCTCPEVWIKEDFIVLMWSEPRHYLYIKITDHGEVAYHVSHTKEVGEVTVWQIVSNLETLDEVMFKLGLYIAGKKETEVIE